MQVKEIMSKNVTVINENSDVSDAAKLMKALKIGSLPVESNNRLVGMLTDRDLALRVVGEGKSPKDTKVKDCMSPGIKYCFEDDTIGDLANNMGTIRHRRLPVLDKRKKLVGMISIGDLARKAENKTVTHNVLQDICS